MSFLNYIVNTIGHNWIATSLKKPVFQTALIYIHLTCLNEHFDLNDNIFRKFKDNNRNNNNVCDNATFSLDVDGPELQILETIPWSEVDIPVLGIEVNHVGEFFPGTLDELRNILFNNGYKIYQKVAIDEIYVKKSFLKKLKQ